MKHISRKVITSKHPNPEWQYTYVGCVGSDVVGRWRDGAGAPVYTKTKYDPTYYVPAADPENALALSYDGIPLDVIECSGYRNAKKFLQEAEESGTPVYGNIQTEYMLLGKVYEGMGVPNDPERLYTWNIDIETGSEGGFAKPEDPFQPVVTIAVQWRHRGDTGIVVYGTKDYWVQGDETYVQCVDEAALLTAFLADYCGNGDYPDALIGWNISQFDIPYLIKRTARILGEETALCYSPFKKIGTRNVIFYGKDQLTMTPEGVIVADYLQLYRKFTYTQQESYRLDHIAHIELGKRKLSYAEYRSLHRLYEDDFDRFVKYNIQDVLLVDELDDKMKLIEMVCALAYGAKANFADTFKQVRLWDVMIYHKLRAEGKQIPPRKDKTKTEKFAGAFVKDPQVGLHQWVVTFDVASLYPHIIREWNLSPEVIASRETVNRWPVEDFLTKKVDKDEWDANNALLGNGLQTRRDREGFLPNMLKTMYDERIRYKGLMKQSKVKLELVKEEKLRRGL